MRRICTTLFAWVSIGAGANAQGTPNGLFFQAQPQYDVGFSPRYVAVGDFNADGRFDLATANASGNDVSVLLGIGDATFQTAVNYPVGTSPRSVAVGDFNGDGRADLAVANANSSNDNSMVLGNVRILLGNGDGTFSTSASYPVGASPRAVAVGDFDRNGTTDLVVTNSNSNSVSVLLGNGDATFQAAVSSSVGARPRAVAVGDFNGDGRADVVVANFNSGDISVLLASGSATFQPAVSYPIGSTPALVALADFNADGKTDLAVGGNPSGVSVLLGNGDGVFQSAVPHAGSSTGGMTVGDFNGDGKPDIGAVTSFTMRVSLGVGDGTFENPVSSSVGVGSGAAFVALGDFNSDGIADVILADSSRHHVSLLLGNGDGTFPVGVTYVAGITPRAVASADLNGDGTVDLAVANNVSNDVSVFLGSGDGTFQTAVSYAVGVAPVSVAVGDFDSNGTADLAVANVGSDAVSVLLGIGDGTFQPRVNHTVSQGPRSIVVRDFNGDGKADLAVAAAFTASDKTLAVLLGNGDGTFQTPVSYLVGPIPYFVASGDLNGDGWPDIATANAVSNDISVLLNVGNGTFQSAVNYGVGAPTPTASPSCVAIGDFNGDGKADLVVANNGSGDLSMLRGNGDGTFQASTTFNWSAGTSPRFVAVGDLNGDGSLDLVVVRTTNLNVNVLLGNGNGTFQPARNFVVGSIPFSAAVADFNGDDKPDLAVPSGSVSVLLANGARLNTPLPPQMLTTSTVLFSGTNPSATGESVTITAAVNSIAGPPPGMVAFSDGGVPLGTRPVIGGVATLSTAAFTAGTHSITAVYGGNTLFLASSAAPLSQEVAFNTPMGTGVEVHPTDATTGTSPVSVTFAAVTAAGTTALVTSSSGPPPPAGFLLGNPPTYYELTTTAVFVPPITVCISYSGVSYGDESELGLFHYEAGVWIDRTSSLDVNANVICAQVGSLSPFAVFERPRQADIAISQADSPDPVATSANLTYTVTITNNGPAIATGITLVDVLPTAAIMVSTTSSQGSCTGTTTVTCALGGLANGGSATVTLVVKPMNPGILTNIAAATADEPDTNPSNNSATATTAVNGTLAVAQDAFLRSGADDTNEGANERLRIQSSGSNRAVLAFDLTGVPTVGLQSATLVLTIAENSSNWGSSGRLVDAHRLQAPWAEGNGRNDVMAGGGPSIRGTGDGVTWRCAQDTNIANQSPNCAPPWTGGTYAPATSAGALHTNSLVGQVSWNVTADMLAGASNGWIVRKREEGQNGQVRYYSREGADLAGDPNFAPRLVLVYAP